MSNLRNCLSRVTIFFEALPHIDRLHVACRISEIAVSTLSNLGVKGHHTILNSQGSRVVDLLVIYANDRIVWLSVYLSCDISLRKCILPLNMR